MKERVFSRASTMTSAEGRSGWARVAMCGTVLGSGLAVTSLLAASSPAAWSQVTGSRVSVHYSCQAVPPIGPAQNLEATYRAEIRTPDRVRPGQEFTQTIVSDAQNVPTTASGFSVKELKKFSRKFKVTNADIKSVTLSGGIGYGSKKPTVTVDGEFVTLLIPGPVKGGSDFQAPNIELHLVAHRQQPVVTSMAGTSHADPGTALTSNVKIFFKHIDVPATCFPDANPVLSSVVISHEDPQ